MNQISYKVNRGRPLPLGVTAEQDGNAIHIAVVTENAKRCRLKILKKGEKTMDIPMFSMKKHGIHNIFSVSLTGEQITEYLNGWDYVFEADKKEIADPYAKRVSGRDKFGKRSGSRRNHSIFDFERFDWSGEKRKNLPFRDSIFYQCHVRGFTKHQSSGVEAPGTFLGVTEKIKYLKRLGVNTLLFLPIYDFNEYLSDAGKKVNYWGYTSDSFYFAPKASYGTGERSPVHEFRQMIKTLHQNGFQVFLDMHFEGKTPDFIIKCLRYYVIEFHIDGFLINQDIVSKDLIIHDPILNNSKLLGVTWGEIDASDKKQRFASFNDEFLINARCFLKSDERRVYSFYQRFKNKGEEASVINYITQKNGFTLRDLVSYDIKHNKDNGERNEDGTEYNYSWNCGQEGTSRRKKVQEMRKKQVKNALSMLLLSLGTPMILAGDEFGNSQNGNNNAYCQDNYITWLNWTLLEKNTELFDFTRMLIRFRKTHPIYRMEQFQGTDYKGLGIPDISCHGIEPWISNFVNYSRELGILFYGGYLPGDSCDSIYIVFNMHWEEHTFYLPKISIKGEWEVLFTTSGKNPGQAVSRGKYVLDSRSIAMFRSHDGS